MSGLVESLVAGALDHLGSEFRSRLRGLVRPVRFWWQRRTRGFDDSVTWSLDQSLARMIAPRLKAFRDEEARSGGTPGSYFSGYEPTAEDHAEWLADLDKMIAAFEWAAKGGDLFDDEEPTEDVRDGLALFAEHYFELWT